MFCIATVLVLPPDRFIGSSSGTDSFIGNTPARSGYAIEFASALIPRSFTAGVILAFVIFWGNAI